jgi:hypothetical protein
VRSSATSRHSPSTAATYSALLSEPPLPRGTASSGIVCSGPVTSCLVSSDARGPIMSASRRAAVSNRIGPYSAASSTWVRAAVTR